MNQNNHAVKINIKAMKMITITVTNPSELSNLELTSLIAYLESTSKIQPIPESQEKHESIDEIITDIESSESIAIENAELSDLTIDENHYDVTGAFWDPNLHSAGKTKTADGKWRKRRNNTDESNVEQSLIIPPPPPADLSAITFSDFINRVIASKIDKDDVVASCVRHGVASVPLLVSKPDLLPLIANELGI